MCFWTLNCPEQWSVLEKLLELQCLGVKAWHPRGSFCNSKCTALCWVQNVNKNPAKLSTAEHNSFLILKNWGHEHCLLYWPSICLWQTLCGMLGYRLTPWLLIWARCSSHNLALVATGTHWLLQCSLCCHLPAEDLCLGGWCSAAGAVGMQGLLQRGQERSHTVAVQCLCCYFNQWA